MMLSSLRLGRIFSGVVFKDISSDQCCDDAYGEAAEMLSHLTDYLSAEFVGNERLRFYGAAYLANIKACGHATWKDYTHGAIGDKELAFVVEVAARHSLSQMEAQFSRAEWQV